MGNGAKLALVGVLALIVLVVAVWDRRNEELHNQGVDRYPMASLDPEKPGPRVRVVTSEPVAENRMSGQLTPGPLSTQGSMNPAGKTPIVRRQEPSAGWVGRGFPPPGQEPVAPAAESRPVRGTTVVEAGARGAPAPKRYTLKAQDTLAAIALREYGTRGAWKRIADANRDVIKDPNRLPLGKEIVIPPAETTLARTPTATTVKPALSHTTEVSALPAAAAAAVKTYVVEKGDTLAKIASRLLGSKDKWKLIQDANKDKLPNESSLKVGQELVIPAGR